MAMIKCSECGRDISDKAAACPHCGAPVIVAVAAPPPTVLLPCSECGAGIPDKAACCPNCGAPVTVIAAPPSASPDQGPLPTRPRRWRRAAWILGAVVLLVVGGVLISAALGKKGGSRGGQFALPGGNQLSWVERAQGALQNLLSHEQLSRKGWAQSIGHTVIMCLHPSGTNPKIIEWKVSSQGQTLIATFLVEWNGGILGTPYRTDVIWKCTEMQCLGVTLKFDNGPGGVSHSDMSSLAAWLQNNLYPALLAVAPR